MTPGRKSASGEIAMKLNTIVFRVISLVAVLVAVGLVSNALGAAQPGPVAGATVVVKLAPGDSFVANCVTNKAGECTFTYAPAIKPASGVFDLTITAPAGWGTTPKNVSVPFTAKQGPTFTYVVTWTTSKAANDNRGGFAVSGRSSN